MRATQRPPEEQLPISPRWAVALDAVPVEMSVLDSLPTIWTSRLVISSPNARHGNRQHQYKADKQNRKRRWHLTVILRKRNTRHYRANADEQDHQIPDESQDSKLTKLALELGIRVDHLPSL